MHPLKTSAQFAAFVWFTKQERANPAAASRFANLHWQNFLPAAHEGLGLLLTRIAEPARHKPARGAAKRRVHARAG
jgi:hypothetical protein